MKTLKYIPKLFQHRRALFGILTNYIFMRDNTETTLWGSISDDELEALKDLVLKAAQFDGPIIEVGALFGLTTQFISSHKSPDKELITIENFTWNPFFIPPDDHRAFIYRILYDAHRCRNTRVFDGDSSSFYSSYEGVRPSMVFIDADHQYESVLKDLEWACRMKIPIISGHDYSDLWPGVKKAVNETFPSAQIRLSGSVWSVLNN